MKTKKQKNDDSLKDIVKKLDGNEDDNYLENIANMTKSKKKNSYNDD